jgi:hypothetical protein
MQNLITQFFNKLDPIDAALYGIKAKLVVFFSFLVLVFAPLLDEIFQTSRDWLTYYSTLLFVLFLSLAFLCWISSWREDDGSWTWNAVKARLRTYYEISKIIVKRTKTDSGDEQLYRLARLLIMAGVVWKALQNVSVFVRHPIESLLSGTRFSMLRNFERFTNHWFWIPLVIGFGIMLYLWYNNRQITKRLTQEFRQFWSVKNNRKPEKQSSFSSLIVNAKDSNQIQPIIASNQSNLVKEFLTVLQSWQPMTFSKESDYQNALHLYLAAVLPNAVVRREYPIKSDGKVSRPDIVIDDTLLIEMKRRATGIDRAVGQIDKYTRAWNNRGAVILLLCDCTLEDANKHYAAVMQNLTKQNYSVLTIVN